MNRPKRFKRSVDVLARAYFDGDLRQGDPCACAVGNLVASVIGADTSKQANVDNWPDHSGDDSWFGAMVGVRHERHSEIATVLPYSNTELVEIEEAFESSDTEFDGLMDVLDVLFEIHEIEDRGVMDRAQNSFVKQPA